MTKREELIVTAKKARKAAAFLACAGAGQKNELLRAVAQAVKAFAPEILKANGLDCENARKAGMRETMIDRLALDEKRIAALANSVEKVISLPDPIGKGECFTRPNGLAISKVHVPLGVIGIIYESRPNVTLDAAVLCLKSGNAVILRGGKEAILSNTEIVKAIRSALSSTGFPAECVSLIEDTTRESTNELIRLHGYVDLIIPRGGAGLIKSVVENASVPVIETGAGNCHLYIHSDADIDMAEKILINAKAQRPGVCNAIENLLVHRDIAEKFLPVAAKALIAHNVEIRADDSAKPFFKGFAVQDATQEDFFTEYDDYIISVKVVDSLGEAIEHINLHGTRHSEAIVTSSIDASERFMAQIDAAAVYTNASTRFTDGEEFGYGAEIGISSGKLHARGPMGLNELTTIKYVVRGNGQTR